VRKHLKFPEMISDITDSSFSSNESKSASLTSVAAERIFESVLGRISEEPARVRTDAQGHVIQINPAFSGLCGYQFEEIRGRKPGSLLQGPATTPESILNLREAIRDRKKCCVEMLNYHKNQTTYRVQIDLSPQFNILGELEGFEAVEHKLD
jgi:PAS domain S-box-containing protein